MEFNGIDGILEDLTIKHEQSIFSWLLAIPQSQYQLIRELSSNYHPVKTFYAISLEATMEKWQVSVARLDRLEDFPQINGHFRNIHPKYGLVWY